MSEPLGQMMIELGLDSSKFGDGLKNAKSQLKYFDSQMKAEVAFYDAFGRKVDSLSAKERGLAHEISDQANVVAKAKKKYDESLSSTGKLSQNSARLAANFEKEQAHLASLTKSYIQTAQAEAEMSVRTTGVTGAINKLGTAQIAIGNRMKSIGDKMTTGITVPIAAAFAAATAKAIKFQNQMTVIKNLLTTGGESAKEAMSGVNQMQSDAVKYSDHYGVSVEKISAGYEELVRRGYTSKQAIAAMKTELQGALASGDDFNDVVSVASSTLESFGMKSNSTATMTRNTKTAVNELAYAADLTATDFQQLGVGMSYVGATAHQAHFTLSETASALGVLSNNGLEADKAGTGLRKVIVSLNTAVKNIGTKKDVLASLGIKKSDIVQSNGQLKNLSTVMDVLNQHTKSMSATKKAAVFNTLFGTTGQQAGIILAQNSKQLAALNSQVDKAEKKNYVGSLSEKNLKSAQNQIKVLRQNVENLGMTIAQRVLPSVQPLIKDATDAVKWFSQLNPQMQQNIVKWGLLAAAMGPVLSLVGRFNLVSGQIKNGLIGLIAKLAGLSAKSTATKDVMAQLTDASGNVIGTLTKTGGAAERSGGLFGGLAGKLTVAAGETGALGTAMTPLGLGLVALAGAVTVGAVAWEAWGKQAYENSVETDNWGTSVGRTADNSLTKFKNFNAEASEAMSGFSSSAKSSAKQASDAFANMYRTIHQSAKDTNAQLQSSLNSLPSDVRQDLQGGINEQKKANTAAAKQAEQIARNINTIRVKASKENRNLTSDEAQYVLNSQKKMNDLEVQTLNLSSAKKRTILRTLNGDIKGMNKDQLFDSYDSLSKGLDKENQAYDRQKKVIKDLYDNGKISVDKYATAIQLLDSDHAQLTNQMVANLYKVMKAEGDSSGQIERSFKTMGVSMGQVKEAIRATSGDTTQSLNIIADTASKMSNTAKKAGDTWNSIVLNPKTGEVHTNLQKVLDDTAKTDSGWKKLVFAAKHAKISSNARAEIGIAAIESGRWERLPWSDKYAMIRSNADATMVQVLETNNKWNTLTFKQQEAIISAKGGKELADAVYQAGIWNSLNIKDQEAMITTKGVGSFVDALDKMGVWQKLDAKEQYAIVTTKGTAGLADLIIKYGSWQKLPDTEKRVLMNDSQFMSELQNAAQSGKNFAAAELWKQIGADKTNFDQGISQASTSAAAFSKTTAKKPVDADTQPFDNTIQKITSTANPFTKTKPTIPVDANTAQADSKIKNTKTKAGGKVTIKVDPKDSIETISSVANAIKNVPNRKPDINVNGHDSKSKAEGIHRAIKGIPNRKPDVNLNGHGSQAKAAGIRDTIKQIPIRKVSDIYITTHKTTITETKHKRAGGDDDFVGGNAIVNDQKGPVFREWINDPVLGSFIPRGRNVIVPLHKHATVTPAGLTAKMFKGIPQYAGGKDIPANATALTMAKSIVAQNTINTSGDAASQNKLLDEMGKNNVLLQYLITLITPKMTETDSKPQINTNQVLRALASALGPYSHQITASASRTGGL